MQPDQLLIKISEHNSHKAFKQLFEMFYPSLCLFGRRYLDSHQEAVEDIVQDAFVTLWENRKTIKIETSVRHYLITMVRNSCLNYLQRNQIEQSYIERKSAIPDNSRNDLEDLILFSELKTLITETLKELPPKYQQVFIMNRFENKTYREIAESLGISIKSVERYKLYAERSLRENLQDYLSIIAFILTIQIISKIY